MFNMLPMATRHVVLYKSSVHVVVAQRHWGRATFGSVAFVDTSIQALELLYPLI